MQLDVRVHPLLLLGLSDHITRAEYTHQYCSSHSTAEDVVDERFALAPVLGVLLGMRQVRDDSETVEVMTSFELVFLDAQSIDSQPRPPSDLVRALDGDNAFGALRRWYLSVVDWEAVAEKRSRMREVFPLCEVVGWYTVGAHLQNLVCAVDLHVNVLSKLLLGGVNHGDDGALLACLLTPHPPSFATRLPLTVYQCMPSTTEAGTTGELCCSSSSCGVVYRFTELSYELCADELERIAVGAALNVDTSGPLTNPTGGGHGGAAAAAAADPLLLQEEQLCSALQEPLQSLLRATQILRMRISLMIDFLQAYQRQIQQPRPSEGASEGELGEKEEEAEETERLIVECAALRLISRACAGLPCHPLPAVADALDASLGVAGLAGETGAILQLSQALREHRLQVAKVDQELQRQPREMLGQHQL